MRKCLLLIRVSTAHQDLEQQTKAVEAEAIKDGYLPENIYAIEDVESAIKLSEAERNGLNKMKRMIENDHDIDCVYVYEISRISRQAKIVFSIRDYLCERGIQLIILKPYIKVLNDDGTLSETSTIFFSIFSGLAENEMFIKKARMRRGVEKAKALGKHAGGQIPFGYRTDKDHNFLIDDEQAETVKWIYKKYIDGMSMRRLAKDLIERGIFKGTFLTTVNNINNILHNDRYKGAQKGKPRIISDDIWEQAQAICRRKILHTEKKETKRLLKGMLYDRNNGFLLSVNRGTGVYYSKRASGVAVSFDVIEPLMWDYVKRKWSDYNNKNLNERAREYINDILILNKKINVSSEKIDVKKAQIDKLEERIILGKVSEQLADKMSTKLNDELWQLENDKIKWMEQENEKQEAYRRIMNKASGMKMSDGSIYYEAKFNNDDLDDDMNLDDKIEAVRKIIDKIILDRPKRYILNIEIINKIDGKSKKMKYDTFRKVFLA